VLVDIIIFVSYSIHHSYIIVTITSAIQVSLYHTVLLLTFHPMFSFFLFIIISAIVVVVSLNSG